MIDTEYVQLTIFVRDLAPVTFYLLFFFLIRVEPLKKISTLFLQVVTESLDLTW